ncbi:leukotriene C4 synthase isoform X1 [Ochotona curzoniae]|uniref:leukotriene C4 synthase isoform X1 n=1 Tax=Ochotona curzoniae TaxID=130825 RepID=UPI001B34663D|nr:leukotriene C4 synthase isoform X1 [Ochotona curzoniae]
MAGPVSGTMKDEVALLATVTLLGVLLQGHFCAQGLPRVTAAHHRPARLRTCLPSPVRQQGWGAAGWTGSPRVRLGPVPAQQRIIRPAARRVNCSEYFPLFLAALWVAGIYFHEGAAAACGLVYLFARLRYFQGYARAAQLRLAPLYKSAGALWLLVALAALGLLLHFLPAPLSAALLRRLRMLLPWA